MISTLYRAQTRLILGVINSNSLIQNVQRSISVSQVYQLKEIRQVKEGDTTIVEGVNVESPRQDFLLKVDSGSSNACVLCKLNLPIQHTDVLILSQFVRSDGCLLPRRVTGLCRDQQRTIKKLVAEAQRAGLMPNLQPGYGKKDPKQRFKWKKWNRYFETDEEIKWKEIKEKEKYYYEKPKRKPLTIQDIL